MADAEDEGLQRGNHALYDGDNRKRSPSADSADSFRFSPEEFSIKIDFQYLEKCLSRLLKYALTCSGSFFVTAGGRVMTSIHVGLRLMCMGFDEQI